MKVYTYSDSKCEIIHLEKLDETFLQKSNCLAQMYSESVHVGEEIKP